MIDSSLKDRLICLADKYENKDFISSDPVQFIYKFSQEKDIEISAFISQWLAFGQRNQIIAHLEQLFDVMGSSPYQYIAQKKYISFKDNTTCLYRFIRWNDWYCLCECLYNIYFIEGNGNMSMQEVIKSKELFQKSEEKNIECLKILIKFFQKVNYIPNNTSSACKRLCLFLRWLVRKNSPVDIGLWSIIQPKDLIIPVDTHVYRISKQLELTTQNNPSKLSTAMEITNNLKEVFPSDPTRGDFALFGYGVNNSI